VLDRSAVDADDALVVERSNDHRHRIAVEQEAERCLALLQLGDVDEQADGAAIVGLALLDQDDATVGRPLFMACARPIEPCQSPGDPFFLTADRFRIIAARNPDANSVGEPRPRLEQIGARALDLGVALVPKDVAAFRIEKHDALRQDVDRFAQPVMRLFRIRNRRFGLRALMADLGVMGGRRTAMLRSFGMALAGRPAFRAIAVWFRFLGFICRRLGIDVPIRIVRPTFVGQVSEKMVSASGRAPAVS
jgi:hypothetical protein